VRNPVAKCHKCFLPTVVPLLTEERFVTMAEDHGIIAFPKFFPGKPVHDLRQAVLGLVGHPLAHLRTETGHLPQERQRGQPMQAMGKGASQEPPQRQVFSIAPVDGITVGNEGPEAVDCKICPFRIDFEPEPSGKKVFQKEIMIPLAEAYPDPFILQGCYPVYHWPKTGIDDPPPCKPEIEEITCYDKMIHHERIARHYPAAGSSSAPKPVEKTAEPFIGGISGTFEMSIGEEDRLHAVNPGGPISRKPPRSLLLIFLCMYGRLSDLAHPFKARNGNPGKSFDKTLFNPIEISRRLDVPLCREVANERIGLTGTFVNTGAIVVGSLVGLVAGRHLSERIKTTVMQGLGLSVILIGLQMALSGKEPLTAIGCLLLGALTGELFRIEQGVEWIGEWLRTRTGSSSSTFVQGFVSASVLYLTGAMMIVGAIQDGTVGDTRTLYIKSLLDCVASVALASTLGPGVAFSSLSVLLVQGGVTLLAARLHFLREPAVLAAVTATGGLIILGIGINLMNMARIRIGNFLPALLYAIVWAAFFSDNG
jgi:uncharacterized membrane protein YqgA involved in biofilm formation